LRRTPLHALHLAHGARLVPFAGYEMPVQYRAGILAEHLHTRRQAGLFDVSHMGQIRLRGGGAAAALEALAPGDFVGLAPARMRYSLLLAEGGGILDDLMVTRVEGGLFLVVNAARKTADIAHLRERLPPEIAVEPLADRALLALQGPQAAAVLERLARGINRLAFMTAAEIEIAGEPCFATRSGYTGEDGFEISVASERADALAQTLLTAPEVQLVGLGARDTLRLEAGLCLYGHDIGETTTPVAAGLSWTIGRRRRAEGGFPGAAAILRELAEGPPRRRVGIRPEGRAPAREGSAIIDHDGRGLGHVTSGGFGPSVGGPIAMGYVETRSAAAGSALALVVRGIARPARIVPLPFVPHRYHRPSTGAPA